jgi:hypothetical protein
VLRWTLSPPKDRYEQEEHVEVRLAVRRDTGWFHCADSVVQSGLAALFTEEGSVSQKLDGLNEHAALDEEREREFDEWVRRRLSGWSAAQIREFDRWLLDESHFEFVTSVRRAWMRRRLEDGGDRGSEEPAA